VIGRQLKKSGAKLIIIVETAKPQPYSRHGNAVAQRTAMLDQQPPTQFPMPRPCLGQHWNFLFLLVYYSGDL